MFLNVITGLYVENLEHLEEPFALKKTPSWLPMNHQHLGKYKSLFVKQFATMITCHSNIKHKNPFSSNRHCNGTSEEDREIM